MRDDFRDCIQKGVAYTSTKRNKSKDALITGEKHEVHKNQLFIKERSKEDLQSWDAQMNVGLCGECGTPSTTSTT